MTYILLADNKFILTICYNTYIANIRFIMNFPNSKQAIHDYIAKTLDQSNDIGLSQKDLTTIKASLNLLSEQEPNLEHMTKLAGLDGDNNTFNLSLASNNASDYLGARCDEISKEHHQVLMQLRTNEMSGVQSSFDLLSRKDDLAKEYKDIGYDACDHVIEIQGFVVDIKGIESSLIESLKGENMKEGLSTDIRRFAPERDHFSPQDNIIQVNFSGKHKDVIIVAVKDAVSTYSQGENEIMYKMNQTQPMIPGYKDIQDMTHEVKARAKLLQNPDFDNSRMNPFDGP
jgi:hypothetical protein